LLAALVGGCGGSGGSAQSNASTGAQSTSLHVGDTGAIGTIAITLLGIRDPGGNYGTLHPGDGNRWVSVKYVISNDGSVTYNGPSSSVMTALSADRQNVWSVSVQGTASIEPTDDVCSPFPGSIVAGGEETGCQVVELPADAQISYIQFRPNPTDTSTVVFTLS
jgi:hypothetical protein